MGVRLVDVVGASRQSNSSERLSAQKRGSGSLRKRRHRAGDYPVTGGLTEAARQLLADAFHLGLAHRREERQRQRVGGGRFGDRELALAVAELAQVREEVDAGQVGLAGDAALGEAGDRGVAVDLVGRRTT